MWWIIPKRWGGWQSPVPVWHQPRCCVIAPGTGSILDKSWMELLPHSQRQQSALSRWNANWLYRGISALSRDTNPSTNQALHYMVILLFWDKGETIKQLVHESRTIPWQGVPAPWLAGIMLSMEDHPLTPLALCVHYWIFNLWFTGLQWGLVCLWIRDKISE